MNTETHDLGLSQPTSLSVRGVRMQEEPQQLYHQDFRHFDNLIWQVPSWASAIFALTILATSSVLTNLDSLERRLHLDALSSLAAFLLAIFFVLTLLGNVLIRFRLHQGALGALRGVGVPSPWWQPKGGTSLLLIIFVEAAVLLVFAAILAGISTRMAWSLAAGLLLVAFPLIESQVLRAIRNMRRRREEESSKR